MHKPFLNFLYELFSGVSFRISLKELATFYLINAVSLIWVLLQSLLSQLSEFRRRWNVLEDFPKVLFDCTRESFVVWVSRNCFSERRRLHVHHKESRATSKDIWFLSIVFWKHGELSQLTIYVGIVNVLVALFIFYFFFSFV